LNFLYKHLPLLPPLNCKNGRPSKEIMTGKWRMSKR
jgi:hypothetical protein